MLISFTLTTFRHLGRTEFEELYKPCHPPLDIALLHLRMSGDKNRKVYIRVLIHYFSEENIEATKMNFRSYAANLAPWDAYTPRRYYLYGRRRLYEQPKEWLYSPVADPSPRLGFSSNRTRVRADKEPQTVEQVISQGYFSVPASEAEIPMLDDRKQTSWLSLDDAIQQIRQRYEVYSRNVYEIERGKCYAINDLFSWETATAQPASAEQHIILGKRLEGLYAQQRQERIAFWKDVSRLKQTLPDSVQRYLSAHRKSEILTSPGGDSP